MSTNENKPNGLELENDEPRLEAGEINPDNEKQYKFIDFYIAATTQNNKKQ